MSELKFGTELEDASISKSIRPYLIPSHRTFVFGILKFSKIIKWFKSLRLNPQKDTPFIANLQKMNSRSLIHSKRVGLFVGVFSEVIDDVSHFHVYEADAFDKQTKQVLGNESLVVLC